MYTRTSCLRINGQCHIHRILDLFMENTILIDKNTQQLLLLNVNAYIVKAIQFNVKCYIIVHIHFSFPNAFKLYYWSVSKISNSCKINC